MASVNEGRLKTAILDEDGGRSEVVGRRLDRVLIHCHDLDAVPSPEGDR